MPSGCCSAGTSYLLLIWLRSALASSKLPKRCLRCTPSLTPPMPPPAVPNPPPATAPLTLDSIMRSHSLLPNTSGFSSTNRSAAILIPSCAPSVTPSIPSPVASPAAPERSAPRFIPDLASRFCTTPSFKGPVIFDAKAAGSTASSPADKVLKSKAVPGAVSPVSRYMFSKTSGALSAYDPR